MVEFFVERGVSWVRKSRFCVVDIPKGRHCPEKISLILFTHYEPDFLFPSVEQRSYENCFVIFGETQLTYAITGDN